MTQNTLGRHGARGVGGVIEETGGVSDGVNDGLSVFLECREVSDIDLSDQLFIPKPAILLFFYINKECNKLTVGSSVVP